MNAFLRELKASWQEESNFQGVIATTCQNGTRSLLTSAKLSVGYLVVENYKRTQQGALAALLLYLYKLYVVHATTILTCPYVHASSSCPITHPHVFFLRPPYFLHVLWRHTFNLHCICVHHVYTMRNSCPLTSSLTLTPSRLFLILLDPKSFQTALDSITWLPSHMLSIRCRLIKYYLSMSG